MPKKYKSAIGKTKYRYSKMKWSESDVKLLNKAVKVMNKEVAKHEKNLPKGTIVPTIDSVSELKAKITSRKDFESFIEQSRAITRPRNV